MTADTKPLFPDIEIDISGPDGNAFVIIATIRDLFKQLGGRCYLENGEPTDWMDVQSDMTSGNYEHLLEVASRYITIVRPTED